MWHYRKLKIACTVAAIALMGAIGAGVLEHTGEPVAAVATMLALAVAAATVGPRAMQRAWERWVLRIDDAPGEETRSYDAATRARHLAPKLRRLVRRATAPVTVLVVGDWHEPARDGRCRWGAALDEIAAAGADVRLYVPQGASASETERAQALARAHPRCRAITLRPHPQGLFDIFCPVVAWAGALTEPADALLWLEERREEPEQTHTSVEYRNGRNLRREDGMLEHFATSIESCAGSDADEARA